MALLDRGGDVDLVLLDLTMPGVRGFSGLMYLRAQYPSVPVVVVSANDDPAVSTRNNCIGCADSTRGSSDNFSTSCASEALPGAAMAKQSTPSAGMGQPSMILRPYWFASRSAICRRASRPAPRS